MLENWDRPEVSIHWCHPDGSRALGRECPLQWHVVSTIFICEVINQCNPKRFCIKFMLYFNLGDHNIHPYKTGNSDDLILEKVNLECTKRAFFFYKDATKELTGILTLTTVVLCWKCWARAKLW